MSGILRLANTGAGTGRSTLQSNASNDVTFNLPDTGTDNTATILTDDLHSISTANWDGLTINITNADFNVDNGTLFVDESTNRVGIGTTTPGSKLAVVGTGDGQARIAINETGTTNAFVFEQSTTENRINSDAALPLVIQAKAAPSAQPIIFRQGPSTERARLDVAGRLLIGTSTSLSAKYAGSSFQPGLQNAAVSGTCGFFRYANNNDGATLVFNKSRNTTIGSHTVVNNNETLGYIGFTGSDGTEFQSAASITATTDGTPGTADMPGRLVFNTTPASANIPVERMRIRSDGNISVGNAGTEYQKFGINGTITENDGGSAEACSVRATWGVAVGNLVGFQSRSAFDIGAGNTVNNYFHYMASPNTIVSGNLTRQYGFFVSSNLTGATNNYGFYSDVSNSTGRWNFYANGTAQNHFAGNTLFNTDNQSGVNTGSASGFSIGTDTVVRCSKTGSSSHQFFQFRRNNNAATVGVIECDGTSTSYTTSSDYRLKENVVPMTAATDRVKALKPCRFNFKSDATKTVDGFLAHEAQTVVPEAVTGEKDGEEMQAIDTSKLVPLLTAALQEALVEIAELKERVKNLEG